LWGFNLTVNYNFPACLLEDRENASLILKLFKLFIFQYFLII